MRSRRLPEGVRHLLALASTLLGALPAPAVSQPFTIADPEAGAAPVVVAADASPLTRTNAGELARIIEQMSGHLPVITMEAPAGPAILVGTAAEFPDTPRLRDLQGRSPEAFVLHSTADRLHVVGNSLVHSQAIVLGWDFYKRVRGAHGFEKVTDLEGVTDGMVESWKTERTDIPAHAEIVRLFEEGLKIYGGREVPEELPVQWSRDLVPVPGQPSEPLLQLLEGGAESRLFFEKALHCFAAEAGESLTVPFTAFPDHTLGGRWRLRNADTGEVVEEGDVRAGPRESAEVRLRIPRKGLYLLDPGGGYKKGGRLGFGRRHLVVEASPKSEFAALFTGTPPESQPLFFFVPRDTEMFVLRVHASTSHESDVRFYGPDGRLLSEQLRLVTGSDLSLPVDVPVTVPPGAEGIWAFTISRSPRAAIQLRGVPPYLARHPGELLTSREALVR